MFCVVDDIYILSDPQKETEHFIAQFPYYHLLIIMYSFYFAYPNIIMATTARLASDFGSSFEP